MRYQVPQFIEVEDKIFGPLTLKQFVYIAGSLGAGFMLWRSLPPAIALPLALGIVGFGVSLAFIKVNKKPLVIIIEAAFMYLIHGKLYLWQADRKKKEKETTTETEESGLVDVPSLSENKLKDLAWSLDINEKLRKENALTPFS